MTQSTAGKQENVLAVKVNCGLQLVQKHLELVMATMILQVYERDTWSKHRWCSFEAPWNCLTYGQNVEMNARLRGKRMIHDLIEFIR